MTGKRIGIIATVAVVVVGAFVTDRALAAGSSTSTSYRTATVKRATISQTLQRSGTIEPVAQASVAFPISGTIQAVTVQPGQSVTAGQTMATIDPTALQATVTSKQSQVASAQLTLAKALSGASSSSSSSVSSAASTATSDATAALQQARDSVAGAQHDVDTASATAAAALQQATDACNQQNSSSSSSSSSSDCLQALQQSLNAQQSTSAAQGVLAQAESALADLLAQAQPAQRSAQPTTAASSAGSSAAELVADQAAVDAAQADLTSAQQALAQATIVSPLNGTVAAVNLTPGQQVTASSASANVVVVGPGGYEVSTNVPVTDVGSLKLGDDATINPDGTNDHLSGSVVSIGLTPSTSGSTTTYPVVVGLSGSPDGLRNGASAAVTITVAHASDTLAVPTSAVRAVGGGAIHVVTVLKNSKTSFTPVTVGTVGSDFTEIKTGLTAGQTVVIADLKQPLPSLANTNLNRLGGGLGGGALGRGLGG